jgi:RNA polymerase sigma-70 factor (sigma-E family)
MKISGEGDFADYASARIPSLRRLALLLCRDWHSADDLVQATLTKLCVNWAKAVAADSTDAYVRAILVREFLRERRSGWARHVSVSDAPLPIQVPAAEIDGLLDLQAAVSALQPRQRATLVLRFFCDLSVDQAAEALGCTAGTVKSQTAKAITTLRRELGHEPLAPFAEPAARSRPFTGEASSHG